MVYSSGMTPPRQVLARRQDTATSDVRETGRASRLPTELLTEQAARLTVFTTVAAILWSFVLLLDLVLLPALSATWVRNWRIIPLEIIGVVGSALMRWYLCRAGTSAEHKSSIGLGMMLMNAALIAAANAWAMPALPPEAPDVGRPSWMALLILDLLDDRSGVPRQMLMASLAAASFDPLAYFIVWLLGTTPPTFVRLFIMCWPNYACAFVAMVPSRVLQRIGRRLQRSTGARQLSSGRTARPRRDGRSLARRASTARAGGGRQAGSPRSARRPQRRRSALMLRRFEREAQATSALSSPHTIQVFDFGITQEGTFYYVMELLAGRDLESLVREFGPCPPAARSTCCARCATPWPTRTHAVSCTATSSRPTSTSAAWVSTTTSSRCSISAW